MVQLEKVEPEAIAEPSPDASPKASAEASPAIEAEAIEVEAIEASPVPAETPSEAPTEAPSDTPSEAPAPKRRGRPKGPPPNQNPSPKNEADHPRRCQCPRLSQRLSHRRQDTLSRTRTSCATLPCIPRPLNSCSEIIGGALCDFKY